ISARELVPAICTGDLARLQAVRGVGKKTAERIVVELKEKAGRRALAAIELGGGVQPLPDLFLLFLRLLGFFNLGRADHGRGAGNLGPATARTQYQRHNNKCTSHE
ncbi:MAG: helix-hairpin-helix domain-containing protein, partial [Pseudomonadota bacterium]